MGECRRLLIVGGAGYVGAHLATVLTEFGEVVVTGRANPFARARWIAGQGGRVQFVAYDSTRHTELPVTGKFEAVLNLALPSAAAAGRDPDGTMRAALSTTAACLRLLFDSRADRLVHFSTFHVYGASDRAAFDEADASNPQHPYGRNHLACERLCAESATARRVFILRATNMVGPPAHSDLGDQAKLLFLDLCRQAVSERVLTLQNDGLSYRDFVPFADLVAAVRCVLATGASLDSPMNLSQGTALRLDTMARAIEAGATAVLGEAPALQFGEGKDPWRAPFVVSNARLRALGWAPREGFAPEIRQTLEFFRAQS